MKSMSLDNVLLFHQKIVAKTGGSDGIRDIGLIESALNRGFATFGGEELYKEDELKVAAISHGLIRNHGFVDGNKRIGVAVLVFLLKLNSINIRYTQQELIDLGLSTAEGKKDENDIYEWIIKYKV